LIDDHQEVLLSAEDQELYLIVSENVYRQFIEWFGGGPDIAFPIVSGKNGEPIAARSFTLNLRFRDICHSYRAHDLMKVSEIVNIARETFSIGNRALHLIDRRSDAIFLKENKFLQGYKIALPSCENDDRRP
jgi:hypothetical protein